MLQTCLVYLRRVRLNILQVRSWASQCGASLGTSSASAFTGSEGSGALLCESKHRKKKGETLRNKISFVKNRRLADQNS